MYACIYFYFLSMNTFVNDKMFTEILSNSVNVRIKTHIQKFKNNENLSHFCVQNGY